MKQFNSNLLSWLISSGLDEQRAKIYLVCLTLGSASAKDISDELGLKRTAIYDNLERLKEKGLIQVVHEGKRKTYNPLHPKELMKKIEAQKEQLKDLLPDFLAVYAEESKTPFVQTFTGRFAAREVYEDILASRIEEYIYLSPPQLTNQMVNPTHMKDWIKRRVAKGIKSRSLRVRGKEVPKISEYNLEDGYLRQIRYLPSNIDLKSSIYLYGNNVGIISTVGEGAAFILYSPDLAYSLKQVFEFLWQIGMKD
jgi:sugar-specific transcriptional regulator TrmB